MRVGFVTPRLYVVVREESSLGGAEEPTEDPVVELAVTAHEADPWRVEADYVYLFDGHRSLRVRICHYVLRALAKFSWVPRALAARALRMAQAEVLETLRGCDPDAVRSFRVPWNRQLVQFLRRRQPEWVGVPEAARFKTRPGSSLESRAKVSIVLPTYNGVRYLKQAIESCLSQTHSNLELIVVDDGSGPEVRETVEIFREDGRVRYAPHERNRGVAESLNTGFRLSTGSHLTWTSDDNCYEPHAIAEMLGYLARHPDVDFVYAESYEIDEHGRVQRLLRPGPPTSLAVNNFIGACFLYRRVVYERVGDYKPLPLAEDYDYWIRVARTCRMQRLFKPLYRYRAHPTSLTGRHSWREVDRRVTEVKRLNRFGSKRNR